MRRRFTNKRPPLLALGTIAAGGFVLAGCAEDVPEELVFNSTAQCVQSGFSQQICEAEYSDALQRHMREAPRFDALAACEAEYGEGRCFQAQDPAATAPGAGSFFIPFMSGYLVSSLVRNFTNYDDYWDYKRRNRYVTTPIYRNRAGQTLTTTVSGSSRVARPYNVNTRTVARQGFGGRSSSRSFGG